MIFYLTDDVLHSKAPVVEGCVEVNLLLCQNFVVGQDVLYEDVHRGVSCKKVPLATVYCNLAIARV